jgi:hypothetical protein
MATLPFKRAPVLDAKSLAPDPSLEVVLAGGKVGRGKAGLSSRNATGIAHGFGARLAMFGLGRSRSGEPTSTTQDTASSNL